MQAALLELRGDKELMMKAVSQSGDALALASDELKNDSDIVLTAKPQLTFVWICSAMGITRTQREPARCLGGCDFGRTSTEVCLTYYHEIVVRALASSESS